MNIRGWFSRKPAPRPAAYGDARYAIPASIFGSDQNAPRELATYAKMRDHPTLALVRTVAAMPVKAVDWTTKVDDGVPDEMTAAVSEAITPHLPGIVRHLVTGLDYGFALMRREWELSAGVMTYRRFVPIDPKTATAVVDETTGEGAAAKLEKETIGGEYLLWFSYDGDFGYPYGRSRNENVREYAYKPWLETLTKLRMYATKAAGVIPMVRF